MTRIRHHRYHAESFNVQFLVNADLGDIDFCSIDSRKMDNGVMWSKILEGYSFNEFFFCILLVYCLKNTLLGNVLNERKKKSSNY